MPNTTVPKRFPLTLDLKSATLCESFEVVEGDTENYIDITFTNDGIATELDSCIVSVVFSHRQGVVVQSSAVDDDGVEINGNVVTVHLKTISFCSGLVECELKIYGPDYEFTNTTPKFSFMCRESLVANETLQNDVNFSLFSQMLAQNQVIHSDTISAVTTRVTTAALSQLRNATQAKNRYFNDVIVQASAFIPDVTYEQFPYHADIVCDGVTSEMYASLIFSLSDSISGSFAPICETGSGYVRIYATSVPNSAITIPCIRAEVVS